LDAIKKAASSFAVEPIVVEVHDDADIERAISTLSREPDSGLIAMPDSFNMVHRRTIIAQVDRYRLPAMYYFPFFARDGGLISYGPDEADMFRQAAGYVDRILKGAKVGDLPVQQPTKYELVVNLKTAKALGFTIPERGDRIRGKRPLWGVKQTSQVAGLMSAFDPKRTLADTRTTRSSVLVCMMSCFSQPWREAMRRREFIALFGGVAVAWPLAARAQQSKQVRRIGLLMGAIEDQQSYVTAFRGALTKFGWAEGGNLRTDVRWGAGDADKIRSFAKELVDLRPDAIVGQSTPVVAALARLTQTIPIVFVNVADPIGSGLVANLARPGGNLTGFTTDNSALGGKWVELLKEIAPRTARVALMFNPTTAVPLKFYMPSVQAAASASSIEVNETPIHAKDEIEGFIAAQARDQGGGLIVMPDPFNGANGEHITLLAARYRVPAMYFRREFAEAGGLIAYASDFAEQFPQAAAYVDRILKGAKPADLPVQAPTKFDLVINLKTAKTLGLDVPLGMQQRADELIE
jgi:putative ABC transport system substrate-binding protein